MSLQSSQPSVASRRAELLAELFLQEFKPVFISRPTSQDLGYDLLIGFKNEKAGINTFAVEVKSTDRAPASRFPIPRTTFNRIAHSNVPGLLLVADVKRSQLYYAWLKSTERHGHTSTVSISLVEINEETKAELKRQFHRVDTAVAAAG
jgi:hypothetical protein